MADLRPRMVVVDDELHPVELAGARTLQEHRQEGAVFGLADVDTEHFPGSPLAVTPVATTTARERRRGR